MRIALLQYLYICHDGSIPIIEKAMTSFYSDEIQTVGLIFSTLKTIE